MKEQIRTLQIGKHGINENILDEIRNQLKRYKILRIRVLKSARDGKDRKVIAQDVSEKAKARLVSVKGNTFVLEKR
jgi:RNA-binding protein